MNNRSIDISLRPISANSMPSIQMKWTRDPTTDQHFLFQRSSFNRSLSLFKCVCVCLYLCLSSACSQHSIQNHSLVGSYLAYPVICGRRWISFHLQGLLDSEATTFNELRWLSSFHFLDAVQSMDSEHSVTFEWESISWTLCVCMRVYSSQPVFTLF